jgi:hypothetical protein
MTWIPPNNKSLKVPGRELSQICLSIIFQVEKKHPIKGSCSPIPKIVVKYIPWPAEGFLFQGIVLV